jgi:phosphatidylserine decarboxylase
MYHRFHAPHDCRIERVTYISGDTWNVNPIALRRIEKLFCKNERAVLRTTLKATGQTITLVAVAAILVAGIRLNFVEGAPSLRQLGTDFYPGADVDKGQEIGWFEHGSTIVVFAPDGFSLCDNVREGEVIRLGQPLMRVP